MPSLTKYTSDKKNQKKREEGGGGGGEKETTTKYTTKLHGGLLSFAPQNLNGKHYIHKNMLSNI